MYILGLRGVPVFTKSGRRLLKPNFSHPTEPTRASELTCRERARGARPPPHESCQEAGRGTGRADGPPFPVAPRGAAAGDCVAEANGRGYAEGPTVKGGADPQSVGGLAEDTEWERCSQEVRTREGRFDVVPAAGRRKS